MGRLSKGGLDGGDSLETAGHAGIDKSHRERLIAAIGGVGQGDPLIHVGGMGNPQRLNDGGKVASHQWIAVHRQNTPINHL